MSVLSISPSSPLVAYVLQVCGQISSAGAVYSTDMPPGWLAARFDVFSLSGGSTTKSTLIARA